MENTWGHDKLIPDIDVASNFTINTNDGWSLTGADGTTSSVSMLNIAGKITGDGFPSAESFVTDAKGNSVFLGAYGTETSMDPETNLWGNLNRTMMNVDVKIIVDKNGVFLGVLNGQKNEKGQQIMINVQDWNKQFEQKPTRTQSHWSSGCVSCDFPWL